MSRDPGLQSERTRLAWQRTAVLVALTCVLLLRQGLAHQDAVAWLCAGLLLPLLPMAQSVVRAYACAPAPAAVRLSLRSVRGFALLVAISALALCGHLLYRLAVIG